MVYVKNWLSLTEKESIVIVITFYEARKALVLSNIEYKDHIYT